MGLIWSFDKDAATWQKFENPLNPEPYPSIRSPGLDISCSLGSGITLHKITKEMVNCSVPQWGSRLVYS